MKTTKKLMFMYLLVPVVITSVLCAFVYNAKPTLKISPYPDGKNFAFTVTDDPDGMKFEKAEAVYSFLDEIGFKTTIASWMYKPDDLIGNPDPEEQLKSATAEDKKYLEFLQKYQRKGFEIALHSVTAGNDKREITEAGYERFNELFGHYPEINIMHSRNRENIYWGKNVFNNPILRILVGLYDKTPFAGENSDSPYFWGDICKERTKYVRLWGTSDINTLKFNPSMPYHDNAKPYVNYWFSFSDGYSAKYFSRLLSEKNIRKLVKERGASIIYTHFAAGFCKKLANGRYEFDENIKRELMNLANQKEGWFVPASVLLDRILLVKNISISRKSGTLNIKNLNAVQVKGITVITAPFSEYSSNVGQKLKANSEGEIILGDLEPGETKILHLKDEVRIVTLPDSPSMLENMRLIWERAKILLFSHRG